MDEYVSRAGVKSSGGRIAPAKLLINGRKICAKARWARALDMPVKAPKSHVLTYRA